MAKIFRIHKGGATANTGWFDSAQINNQQLNTIVSNNKTIATSIPSPFATFDLVKSAFGWVANDMAGSNPFNSTSTAQHRLVSYALDVGQLFYISNLYPDNVTIVEWNPQTQLANLANTDAGLAQTLNTYWQQDGPVYNFNMENSLFFIFYNGKLIGGTSPATLFFAAPDAAANMEGTNIQRGNNVLFDNKYASLHTRRDNYIEYIFALSKHMPANTLAYNEVRLYLDEVYKVLPLDLQQKINAIDGTALNNYQHCCVTKQQGNIVNVSGIPLGLMPGGEANISQNSDFVIKSILLADKPLVLPHARFAPTAQWQYIDGSYLWDTNTMDGQVPYKNTLSPANSILPRAKQPYHWLSEGNFLEDCIIELPYDIDGSRFELCGNGNRKFLLPLTPLFFEYFEADKVSSMLTISDTLAGGGVQIALNIPVKKGNITFSKTYNKENIENFKLHLAIMPFVEVNFPLPYTVGVIDASAQNNRNKFSTIFYKSGKQLISSPYTVRSQGGNGNLLTMYTKTETHFDCLQVTYNTKSCFIVPKMPQYNPGMDGLDFAVDFGTTNTHIEYKSRGNAEKPIDSVSATPFWVSLWNNDTKNRDCEINEKTFEQEIMPYILGTKPVTEFPLRTALVENKNININTPVKLFEHINNFLLYEKNVVQSHLELHTEIKWTGLQNAQNRLRVELYIKYLVVLVYLKTLMENKNFSNTTIRWFYPTSMTEAMRNALKSFWDNAYKEIFGQYSLIGNLSSMPESLAPYAFYRNRRAITGLSVSIDVGGGSSDIAVFDQNKVIIMSSLHFAGNAIYGDGYGGSPAVNGFVLRYRDRAKEYLATNDQEKVAILGEILDLRQSSVDFSNLLFSIDRTGTKCAFSYSAYLTTNPHMKLSILIFWAAIGYYVAKMLAHEEEELGMPANYLFSGLGSKSVAFIDQSPSLDNLSNLYQFITERVLDIKNDTSINANLASNPKEITCKGGLLESNIPHGVAPKFWLGSIGNNEWNRNFTSLELSYDNIPSELKTSVLNAIFEFYNIIDEYYRKVSFMNIFGISHDAYEIFKKTRNVQIADYFNDGVQRKIKEGGVNIDESLFFYPLVGILNKLSYNLSQLS